MYEVTHVAEGAACRRNQLRDAFKRHRRVLVYFGFQDLGPGFGDLLLRSLEAIGTVSVYNEFADLGRAAVVDLHDPGSETVVSQVPTSVEGKVTLGGCVGVTPALRW